MAQINGTVAKNNYEFYAILTETLPSDYLETNKSIVTYGIYLKNHGTRTNSSNWTFYAEYDGTEVYNSSGNSVVTNNVSADGGYVQIFGGNFEVTHNSGGDKEITFAAHISKSSYTQWDPGYSSLSGVVTLTTIPRASNPQLSNNNFNIGDTITLKTNRKSNTFTHTVVLTFGNYTKTYTNVGNSQAINTSQFASNMYAQIPSAKKGTGTITTTTYSGSTQIGSSSTLQFTANAVEGNVNPQITALTYSVDSTTSSLANSTTFIKGVTNATINVTANRRMSATLTKVFLWYYSGTNKVVLSSQNVNADGTYTFTINGISVSKVYGGATDTRGYTTYNTSINNVPTTFKNYVTLTADTNATIKRIVQTEPNVRINSFTGNYWNDSFRSGNANTLTIKWRYKETTASSYSAQYTIPASSISISNNKYTISNYTLTNGSTTELFNYQKAYHIQISVTDKIGTKSVVYTITSGQPNFAIFPNATISNQEIVTDSIRGKNLLNYYYSTTNSLGIASWMKSTQIKINGTTTGTGNLYYSTTNTFTLDAGTYTISTSLLSGSFTRNSKEIAIYVRNMSQGSTGTNIFEALSSANFVKSTTITLSSATNFIIYVYTNGSGFVANNILIGMQIEKGTSATLYQEYQELNSKFEIGNTGNNYYIAYPNGVLVCYGTVSQSNQDFVSYEGAYYHNIPTITFAREFYTTPSVQLTPMVSSGLYTCSISAVSTTGCTGYIWRIGAKNGVNISVHYLAIGRWK